MTDPVPSKELCAHFIPLPAGTISAGPFVCPWCEIDRLQRQLEPSKDRLSQVMTLVSTINSQARELARLAETIESAMIDEAARRPSAPEPSNDLLRQLVESAYKDGYGEDLTDDRDLSARTLELMRRLQHEPSADLAKWLRHEASFWRNDAFENAAKICERYEAHDAARDIRHLKGSTQPPRDG